MKVSKFLTLIRPRASSAVNTVAPALGASPVVGTQLSYTPGTWTNAVSVSVQAQRRRLGGAWANVGSAWDSIVGTPYTPVAGDAFYTFQVIETATPGAVTATSNETAETVPANLSLRLDASNAATLFQDSAGTIPATADSDPVGRWSDTSGNNRHATQGTAANRPLLRTAVLNGRNTVRADGTNDVLNGSVPLPLNFTAMFVMRVTGGTSEQFGLAFRTSAPAASALIYRRAGITRTNDRGAAQTYTFPAGFEIVTIVASGGTSSVYRNGALQGSAAQTFANIGDLYYLFAEVTGNFGAADLAEMVVIGASASTDLRNAINSYASVKWGITLNP